MGMVLILTVRIGTKNFVLRKRLSHCESLLNTFGTSFQTIVVILKYDRDYKNLVNIIYRREILSGITCYDTFGFIFQITDILSTIIYD